MKNQKTAQAIAEVLPDFKLGKESAFEIVFKLLYKPFFYYCDNMIDDNDEAEDICLIVFQELFQRCNRFDDVQAIFTFLHVCMRNKCANHFKMKNRRQKRNDTAAIKEGDFDIIPEIIEVDNRMRNVLSAVEELPDGCKNIFKLLVLQEMEPRKVAAMLGITTSTVYSQKLRAMIYLKGLFKNRGPV